MGSESSPRKLRVLGLHGYRTSGAILKKQLSKWSPSIHDLVEFTFLDGPTPAQGKSDVEGIYEGPYFEWMQFNDDYSEFYGYEESIAFLVDYMEKNGPFDGLIGFSQGATLCGALTAVQERGRIIRGKSAAALPQIKFVIFIAGAKLRDPKIVEVFDTPIDRPTLHFLGEKDPLKIPGGYFLANWKNSVAIRHPQGHTVPRLDEEGVSTVVKFLKSVQS
ncbi:unnamed protein product [Calypogeia fissa]